MVILDLTMYDAPEMKISRQKNLGQQKQSEEAR